MRYVCPKDVKRMLVQQARFIYWKKWAAKHEYEESKWWIWLEPSLALLRKKMNEEWTENIETLPEKLVLEGGWVHKKLFDTGWSDLSECQACHKEEGTEKHRLHHCPRWHEVRREMHETLQKVGAKTRERQRRSGSGKEVLLRILSVKANGTGATSALKMLESEKHKSWGMPAEGFKGHVATDGSLLGIAGKWRACGWSVVQMDYDEELGPLHGMYGSRESSAPSRGRS